jgi:hypothetical protein
MGTTRADGRMQASMSSEHAIAVPRHSGAAPPGPAFGRPDGAEPGIHNGIERANPPWIPGSGFAGPGMTQHDSLISG